ncbi:MAG: tetratricopeptide repeat protein [bacterium]
MRQYAESVSSPHHERRKFFSTPRFLFLGGLGSILVCALAVHGTVSAQTDDPADSAQAATEVTGESFGFMTLEDRISDLNAKILAEPRNADNYNNLGVIYAEQEDWLLARDAFISAVQANPIESSFHRNLGHVLARLENYEMAASEFAAYRRLDMEGGAEGYRLVGDCWVQAGQLEQAAAAYREGLDSLPAEEGTEQMRLVLALARMYLDDAQSTQASSVLEEHLELAATVGDEAMAAGDGETVELARSVSTNLLAIYIDDAKLLEESGLSLEAAELYQKAFGVDPARHELLPRIIDSYLDGGEPLQARVQARMARNNHPEAAGTWIATGKIAESESRFADAIEAYLEARRLGWENRDLDLVIGNLYMRIGDSAKAQQYMAAGIDSPDAKPEVIYNYGISLLREKKFSEAVKALQRVVEQRPEMPQAWQALALSLRNAKRYSEAVTAYEKTISFGEDSKLSFNLAYCLKRAGRTDEAVARYEEAIFLDPMFSEAYHNLANTLIAAQRYEKALDVLTDFLVIEPDSYRILFNQGLCLYHLTRYNEAIEKYELAMEQQETADVFNNLGLVYDKLGNKEEANAMYKEAKNLQGG